MTPAEREQQAREFILRWAHYGLEKKPVFFLDLLKLLTDTEAEAWENATEDYRTRIACKLGLDFMTHQSYSKTDIIIALDQVDFEIDQQAKEARG